MAPRRQVRVVMRARRVGESAMAVQGGPLADHPPTPLLEQETLYGDQIIRDMSYRTREPRTGVTTSYHTKSFRI